MGRGKLALDDKHPPLRGSQPQFRTPNDSPRIFLATRCSVNTLAVGRRPEIRLFEPELLRNLGPENGLPAAVDRNAQLATRPSPVRGALRSANCTPGQQRERLSVVASSKQQRPNKLHMCATLLSAGRVRIGETRVFLFRTARFASRVRRHERTPRLAPGRCHHPRLRREPRLFARARVANPRRVSGCSIRQATRQSGIADGDEENLSRNGTGSRVPSASFGIPGPGRVRECPPSLSRGPSR